jgi:hypothetical protein
MANFASPLKGPGWIVVAGFVLLALAAAVLWLNAPPPSPRATGNAPPTVASAPAASGETAGHAGVKPTQQEKGPVVVAQAAFLVEMLAIALIIIGFGAVITGRPSGFIMSSRNAYSLSKLQMAAWTVVVLAALLTTAEINVVSYFGPMVDPLKIDIPGELLAAIGIAAFSFSATPAILALKANQDPKEGQADIGAQRLADNTGVSKDRITNVGKVIARNDRDAAHFSDIVSGDEVANAGTVDLSKVQQLLITLLLLATYVAVIITTFSDAAPITGLPKLSERFIELLALSHAGYLVYKAVPKPDQPTPDGDGGAALRMRAPQAAPPRRAA